MKMMFLHGYISLFVAVIVCVSHADGRDEKKYYRAAVVEHVRFGNFSHSVREILDRNFKTYDIAARIAAENDADIIVFPEWGLYPHSKQNRSWVINFAEDIPDPKTSHFNPCTQNHFFQDRPILERLSCLAHHNKIFVVANIADIKGCSKSATCDADKISSCASNQSDCPEDDVYLHNTNVVFNREGTLIARYYKRHLYFEYDMNPPKYPEDIIFETDFGKFTMCVCFDLMFQEAVTAVEKSNVINVAYPTYWFDIAPFAFSATAYQQAWAMTNRINLLAANVHYPGTGTLGSGIYSSSRGALTHTSNPDGRSKVLISNVPRFLDVVEEAHEDMNTMKFFIENNSAIEVEDKIEREKTLRQTKCSINVTAPANNTLNEYHCFQVDNTAYTFVKLKDSTGTLKSCTDNNFCCHLSYSAISMEEDYFLGAFAGDFVTDAGSFSYGIETCFLTRCDSSDCDRCSNYVTKSKTIFETVYLQGDFTAKYIYPAGVDSDISLTDKKKWFFNGKSRVEYNNSDKNTSLLFLGLTGRLYDRDIIF